MLFRGRLRPNIQWNLDDPFEVRFNSPQTADGVTLRIKEMDSYRDNQGNQISEGSEDDLLATFTGRIINRRFQVASHTNEDDRPYSPILKITFQGSEEVYEIPVPREAEEAEEGTNWEIAFTIEHNGEEVYTSPVSFTPIIQGNILIVDDTMNDLSEYQYHTNRIHHYFTDKDMEAKIVRGDRSNTSVAHYSAEDTDHHFGGYDYQVFRQYLAEGYDYIYFSCHGDMKLVGTDEADQGSVCMLCENHLRQGSFGSCPRRNQCISSTRGFHFYKLRTDNSELNVNTEISLNAHRGLWLNYRLGDSSLRRLVGPFVDWDEYVSAFATANGTDPSTPEPDNPNIIANSGTPTTYNVRVPNSFQFPTLLAFPANDTRPDFREQHLQTADGVRTQEPESSYLHDEPCQAVPGAPVICFMGEGGQLSEGTVDATPQDGIFANLAPNTAAPTPFPNPPSGLTAEAGDREVHLTWNRLRMLTLILYTGQLMRMFMKMILIQQAQVPMQLILLR